VSTLRFLALRYGAFRRCAKREALLQNVLPLYGFIRDQFPGANINDARGDCPCFF
jgi:hypothetical protein